jgi:hypothetical protein
MPVQRTHEDVGRDIDAAKPSDAVKAAVGKDLEDHLPADLIPGQATEEPLRKSQREVQEDEPPGN